MKVTDAHIEFVEDYLGKKLYPFQKELLIAIVEGEMNERLREKEERKEAKTKGS